jgi:predicted TIM-barrel fold metal-dependent hydrolase
MRRSLGLQRSVVVQASAFGNDNSGVLQALKYGPTQSRGVVVIDARVTNEQLAGMHQAGVRAARFSTWGLGGSIGLREMLLMADRLREHALHIEFLPGAGDVNTHLDQLIGLPVTVVVDHLGAVGLNEKIDPLVRLLDAGAYVKLCAYRLTSDLLSSTLVDRVQALYRHAPGQLVWGTDWPHVGLSVAWDAGELLNALGFWFDRDRTALEDILVSNPERLYGFSPS